MFLDELHRYGGNTAWPNQGFEGGLLDASSGYYKSKGTMNVRI